MPRSYDISFVVTETDLVNYLRLMQRVTNMILASIGLGAAGVGAYLIIGGDIVIGAVNVTLGLVILAFSQTTLLDRFRIRRTSQSIVGVSVRLQVAMSGIDIDNAGNRRHLEWSTISGTKVNEKIICLIGAGKTLVWLPAAAIGSADDQRRFLVFIAEQIDAAYERRLANEKG